MNKLVYLGVSILKRSKIVMYKIKKKHKKKTQKKS